MVGKLAAKHYREQEDYKGYMQVCQQPIEMVYADVVTIILRLLDFGLGTTLLGEIGCDTDYLVEEPNSETGCSPYHTHRT